MVMAGIENLRAQEKAELFGLLTQLGIPYDSEHGKYLFEVVARITYATQKNIDMAFVEGFRKMIETFSSQTPSLMITTEDAISTPTGTRLRFPDRLTIVSHLHRDNDDESNAFAKWEEFSTTNPKSRAHITQYKLSYWGQKSDGSRTKRIKWLPQSRPPGYIVKRWEVHTLIGRKGINVNKVIRPLEDEKWEKPTL